MSFFISRLADDPFFVLAWILAISFSICVHEYAHARAALGMGDDTAASEGHLTLNPMVQMGLPSLVMLALFGIAWGAVPVDPRRLRSPWASAWVAFAGPLANLLLCLVFSLLLALLSAVSREGTEVAIRFLSLAAAANGVLFVFNLLPIPMFDGWPVLAAFVPAMRRLDTLQLQPLGWLLLAVVWLTPLGDVIWMTGTRLAHAFLLGFVRLF